MKRLLNIVLCLFVCWNGNHVYCETPSSNNIQATETANVYVTDLNVALKLSRDTKQKLVLIFSATWCGHCKTLKQDFPYIKEFDDKIVCILDSDIEKKLARQFKARSLPTSIVLDSDGNEISRIVGYDKTSYTKWLKESK